jgi:hypothetical protein
MANQNIPAIQVKESNVGIGTLSPLNKLSVSEGSFNLNATQASILNTNYGQKGHVVYDTLLIQQDDAPTIRLYEYLENASTTLSSDGGVSRLATTGILAFNVNGSSNSPGWNGLGGPEVMRMIANGNVGIGTTNPTSKLTVAGNATFGQGANRPVTYDSNGGNFRITANAGGWATGYFFDGNAGTYRGGFGAFGSNDTVNYYWIGDDWNIPTIVIKPNQGNVGIGTTSPLYKTVIQTSDNTVGLVVTTNANDTGTGLYITPDHTNGIVKLLASGGTSKAFGFFTGNDERMRIATNGNVGIGTTNPYSRLSISNGNNTRTGLTLSDGDTASLMLFAGANAPASISFDTFGLRFVGGSTVGTDNGTEHMRITTLGKVGIGTTTPYTKLDVTDYTSFVSVSAAMPIESTTNNQAIAGIDFRKHYALAIGASIRQLQAGNTTAYNQAHLAFYTNDGSIGWNDPIERMRITASGNVGIGTTDPQGKLSVDGGNFRFNYGNALANYYFYLNHNGSQDGGLIFTRNNSTFDWQMVNVTGSGDLSFYSYGASSLAVTFQKSTGNVGIGTTSPSGKLSVLRPGINEGTISFVDANSNAHLFIGGSDAAVRLQMGTYNNGSYGAWIQASYDNGGSNQGTEPLILNPQGGNVGVGTTNPIYRLDVNGGSDTLTARFFNSSAAQTAIAIGDSGNSIYSNLQLVVDSGFVEMWKGGSAYSGWGGALSLNIYNSNGAIAFHPNNTANAMFIATSGNVGIGTTTPIRKLDLVGTHTTSTFRVYYPDLNVAGQDASIDIWASEPGVSYNGSGIGSNVNGHPFYGRTNTALGQAFLRFVNGSLMFHTSTSNAVYAERMRITADGNVGIGTSDPGSYRLSVIAGQYGTLLKGGDLGVGSAVVTMLKSDDSIAMLVRGDGNVGVGTTSPQAKLSVTGTSGAFNDVGIFQITSGTGASANLKLTFGVNDSGYTWIQSVLPGTDIRPLSINPSGGNVGIGTTSPAAKLDVEGGNVRTGNAFISQGSNTTWSGAAIFMDWQSTYGRLGAYNYATGSWMPVNINDASIYSTGSNGNIGIGTTNPAAKLHVVSPDLGFTTGNTSYNALFYSYTGNSSFLEIKDVRTSNGSDWTSVGKRLQMRVDSTYMGYIQFNGNSNNYGISFGIGGTTTNPGNVDEAMRITNAGNVGIGTTSPGAKLEIYGSGSTGSTASLTVRNAVGTKLVNVFDDGLIQLNNLLNINQAIYINSGNSNRHYALESHIFNVVDSSFQRIDFVTIQGNLQSPAMGVGTMSPERSAILDVTSRSKGFLPPRMTNTEMNAISTPAAGLVVYDVTNNKLTVYNGSTWVPLH